MGRRRKRRTPSWERRPSGHHKDSGLVVLHEPSPAACAFTWKLRTDHTHHFSISPQPFDSVSLGVRCFHRLPMRSEATVDPHPHAPARLDLACNSRPVIGESRRRSGLNGRPPVREPAIRQPRGGDSAWEDGGSAVLQVGEPPSFGLGNSSDGSAVVRDFDPPADN